MTENKPNCLPLTPPKPKHVRLALFMWIVGDKAQSIHIYDVY